MIPYGATPKQIADWLSVGAISQAAAREWLLDRVSYRVEAIYGSLPDTRRYRPRQAYNPIDGRPREYQPCEICGPEMGEDGLQVPTRPMHGHFSGETLVLCETCVKHINAAGQKQQMALMQQQASRGPLLHQLGDFLVEHRWYFAIASAATALAHLGWRLLLR